MAERNTLPLSNCSQFSIIVCDPSIIIYIELQIINENDDSKSEIELVLYAFFLYVAEEHCRQLK